MGKASGSQNFHLGWFQCSRWTLHLQFNHSEDCRDKTEQHKCVSHKAFSPSHQSLLQCLLLQVQVLPPLPHIAHSGGCGCCRSNWSEESVQQSPSVLYLGKGSREISASPQSSSSSPSFLPKDCMYMLWPFCWEDVAAPSQSMSTTGPGFLLLLGHIQ